MVRLTVGALTKAARLLGYSEDDVRRVIGKVWRAVYGGDVELTPDERRLLIAAMYLENPLGFMVDLSRPAEPGNPFRGRGDIPGVDTPDARSFALKVIAEVNERLRQRVFGKHPRLEEFLRPRPPAKTTTPTVTAVQKQALPGPEELARFIVYAEKLVEDAKKAYQQLEQLIASGDYSRMADYAEYLTRLVRHLEEAREKARRLYPAGAPPDTAVKIGGHTVFVKPALARLEKDLDSLYHKIGWALMELARQSLEAARKLAEKYEGMKLGLRYRQLYEELEKLYREARAPEDYVRVVRKLAEHMSLESEANSLAERASELRTEAIKLAREMREIARELERLKEPLRRAREERLLVTLARTVGGLEGYAEYLERAAHTEPDYYIGSERFQNIVRAAREKLEEAKRLLEEARAKTQHVSTAVKRREVFLRPAPPRRSRWPSEARRLADYLWENIPLREKPRWRYIQVLQLARLILEKAREAGIDPMSIDWAHEIDWSLGYTAAKQKVLSLLGAKAAPTEKEIEEYQQYMEQQMEEIEEYKPAWMEEKPEEWEIRAWEAAAIPA